MSALRRIWLGACLCALLLSPGPGAQADDAGSRRRFALLIAANDGGPKRPLLKHADHDAQAVAAVLQELGGVADADLILLTQPTAPAITSAFTALAQRARDAGRAGQRPELLFYYSGHSNEYGLLLRGQELSYAALRSLLKELPVDVRVAVLDSCASGAFAREKGGKLRAPFLADTSSDVRGHAFLSSASADETAQESDSIGGSFFTHFLVSGLRGAADSSGDGKVTLTEAYRYAFDETLVHTGRTQYGAQHPAYDIRLAGTGDLVLTDLRKTSSELRLAAPIEGRLLLREAQGRLLLELLKRRGQQVSLGVPQGRYLADLSHSGRFFQASLATQEGSTTHLRANAFREIKGHATRPRGSYHVLPAAAALVERYSTNRAARSPDVLNHLNLSLVYDRPASVRGVQLSLGVALARDELRGLQLSAIAASTGNMTGLQIASLSHARQTATGASFAAFASLVTGTARGALVAPFTWAKDLRGVQIGAVNAAAQVRGLQLGLVNLAAVEVKGLSLGLFNYAKKADVSLAPIAYTKHGGAHLQYELTDVALLSFALRLDASYNYSFVSVRAHPVGTAARRGYSVGAGLGAKIPLWDETVWMDLDLSFHVLQPKRDWQRKVPNSLSQLRGLFRYQLHPHFSLFAGPTFNVLTQREAARLVDLGFPLTRHVLTASNARVRVSIWPGFAGGIRF